MLVLYGAVLFLYMYITIILKFLGAYVYFSFHKYSFWLASLITSVEAFHQSLFGDKNMYGSSAPSKFLEPSLVGAIYHSVSCS